MKRLLLVFALLALVACAGESNFPTATGKGTIRGINAASASPQVGFLVEERLISSLSYKEASVGTRFDDFDYLFNFDVVVLGDIVTTRVASVAQKVDANKDYTFVLTGDVSNPAVTVWVGDERQFDDTETVFELRFAHSAPALTTPGAVDVFFAVDGVAPAMGEQVGTLSFGDILPPLEFAEGDYVLTITTANDPATILFQSGVTTYAARSAGIVSLFDTDELNTGRFGVQVINSVGASAPLFDLTAMPTVRFIQASIDLPNADVYDDVALTNLVLPDHAFGDVTGDMPIAVGTTAYTYTTVGDTSAILFENDITTVFGTHNNFLVLGEQGAFAAQAYIPTRRSVSTRVTMSLRHAAKNHDRIDYYVVDADVPIDEQSPVVSGLTFTQGVSPLAFDAGSYDLYATTFGEKTIIAGPVRLDAALGDVVEVIIFDTVDPATAELRILPNQP